MPTLSAILCNYNHAKYLPQALSSYVDQAPWPTELIVVDDGSTDASRDIIREFASRYSWVKVILKEQNQGWHSATAEALRVATGDYIYCGAADDYILPGFFSECMQLAEQHPQAGVFSGNIQLIDENGSPVSIQRWDRLDGTQYISPENLLQSHLVDRDPWSSLSPATILNRRLVLEAGGYRKELGFWADTFMIRAIGLRTGIVYLDRECTCFRTMAGGMSGSALRSPERLVSVRKEVIRLMGLPEFSPSFPRHYARKWARDSLQMVWTILDERIDRPYQQLLVPVDEAIREARGWRKYLVTLLKKILSLQIRSMRYIVTSLRIRNLEK